jgi:hypothetical protein
MRNPTLRQVIKAEEYAIVHGIKNCESAHDWIDWLYADGQIGSLETPRIARYRPQGKTRYAVVIWNGDYV